MSGKSPMNDVLLLDLARLAVDETDLDDRGAPGSETSFSLHSSTVYFGSPKRWSPNSTHMSFVLFSIGAHVLERLVETLAP